MICVLEVIMMAKDIYKDEKVERMEVTRTKRGRKGVGKIVWGGGKN